MPRPKASLPGAGRCPLAETEEYRVIGKDQEA